MPNIAALLKQEITRLSRKELRAAITPLKKQIASLRHEVATLKKERAELHRTVSGLAKASRTGPATKKADVPDGEAGGRISSAGIKSLRARLGLSAEAFGTLVGATGQSVYNWEKGARPRQQQLTKILALRGKGKREVVALLDAAG